MKVFSFFMALQLLSCASAQAGGIGCTVYNEDKCKTWFPEHCFWEPKKNSCHHIGERTPKLEPTGMETSAEPVLENH